MKLHEALAQLKEDGSNYAVRKRDSRYKLKKLYGETGFGYMG